MGHGFLFIYKDKYPNTSADEFAMIYLLLLNRLFMIGIKYYGEILMIDKLL